MRHVRALCAKRENWGPRRPPCSASTARKSRALIKTSAFAFRKPVWNTIVWKQVRQNVTIIGFYSSQNPTYFTRTQFLNAENENLAMMFSSKELSLSVPNVSSGYKEKPLAVVAPIQRPALNLGISPEHQSGLVDGSLPSSPECDCDEAASVGCFLEHNTREIIGDFFLLFTSPPRPCGRHNKVLQTIRRVVDSLLGKHELAYKGNTRPLSSCYSQGAVCWLASFVY